MAGYVIVGMLAAFGLLCALWVMFGWLLPGGNGGCLICAAKELCLVKRLLWLRELGLLRCPICVYGADTDEEACRWLARHGIGICGPEGPELERNRFDGTGNGNYTGHDQCRGISEL